MQQYLASSQYIDWENPAIRDQARQLSEGVENEESIAQLCFEFVRDEIKHSGDFELNPVTCKASDVLKHATGYCYAKSHLLAALLRANGIAAGLCYQRVTITEQPPFCLHGLNAVYLKNHGWYRIDARGNKIGVAARFCPPVEKLAFSTTKEGELTLAEIFSEPLAIVVKVLEESSSWLEVANKLPDTDTTS